MREKLLLAVLTVAASGLAPTSAAAQSCGDPPDMLIVLDRSGSMSAPSGALSKWTHAVNAVNSLITNFNGQIRFGLMLFPAAGTSCGAGKVNVGVSATTQGAIAGSLAASFPGGNTPLEVSLKSAHTYLIGIDPTKTKYVLLVTDGSETCNGQPVSSVQLLAGANIKTYVVGFGSGVSQSQLNAMATAGGTGSPYKADSPAQLNTALQSIGSQVSCCGNGILDAGEKCDTAIAAGKPGACPTQCDDGNPCTTDSLGGSSCNVGCSSKPVLTPKNNDQCCPPGANSVNDNDCSTSCGNGVLEQGEICDPKIAAGPGACKTAADCDDKDVCTADTVAGTACNVVCKNEKLVADPLKKDGCCLPGNSIAEDADCPPTCGPDKQEGCVDLCQGVVCPDGQYCSNGACKAWPADNTAPEEPSQQGETIDIQGGCACEAAGGGPGPALSALALLLLLAPLARHRRR